MWWIIKYILLFILILIVFIFWINISNINVSQNKLLQDDLKYFEEEIQSPNNDYPEESYVINKNAVSKIADKIDRTINKIIEKAKDIIKTKV